MGAFDGGAWVIFACELILLPLVVLSLGVMFWGLGHGPLQGVLLVRWIGVVLLVVGIFLDPLVYVG